LPEDRRVDRERDTSTGRFQQSSSHPQQDVKDGNPSTWTATSRLRAIKDRAPAIVKRLTRCVAISNDPARRQSFAAQPGNVVWQGFRHPLKIETMVDGAVQSLPFLTVIRQILNYLELNRLYRSELNVQ